MLITQEYMNSEVINPMARRLAEIEKKIDKLLEREKECVCGEPEIVIKPEQPKLKKRR